MRDEVYIRHKLVLEFKRHFEEKSRDYSSVSLEPHRVLGVRGQFADVWRKIWKLKKALWDGEELKQEQPREILLDLIGHCFLTIAMIDRNSGAVDEWAEDEDEEDLTTQGEKANEIIRKEGRDYLRKRAAPRRREYTKVD